MNASADLRIEHVTGEDDGDEWMRIGEALHREFNDRASRLAAMVQGRRIYETMESFWPAARHDGTLPGYPREYGEIWTSKPKILISGTRTTAAHNTRVVGGIEELAALRAASDGDVGVGGATVATQLLRAGLLDELLLFIHPVVLGRGRPLFDGQLDPVELEPVELEPVELEPVELDLVEQGRFESGVALHRYAVRTAGDVR